MVPLAKHPSRHKCLNTVPITIFLAASVRTPLGLPRPLFFSGSGLNLIRSDHSRAIALFCPTLCFRKARPRVADILQPVFVVDTEHQSSEIVPAAAWFSDAADHGLLLHSGLDLEPVLRPPPNLGIPSASSTTISPSRMALFNFKPSSSCGQSRTKRSVRYLL